MGKRGSERQVSDERILLEFLLTSDPALFTTEIAEPLPVSRQRVNSLLDDLEENGFVTSKKASGRRLWWMTDRGHDQVAKFVRREID